MITLLRAHLNFKLIQHQIIRFKLAEMARQIESLHDNLERVCYLFSQGIPDHKLGGQCALLKVQASKTLEVSFCDLSLLTHSSVLLS